MGTQGGSNVTVVVTAGFLFDFVHCALHHDLQEKSCDPNRGGGLIGERDYMLRSLDLTFFLQLEGPQQELVEQQQPQATLKIRKSIKLLPNYRLDSLHQFQFENENFCQNIILIPSINFRRQQHSNSYEHKHKHGEKNEADVKRIRCFGSLQHF